MSRCDVAPDGQFLMVEVKRGLASFFLRPPMSD